jgi:4'-phosphopantetheinyl transferase EntD
VQLAMIEQLVPGSASAEMFSDAPESAMFASEAATVAGAVSGRRREFGTVRHCARDALARLGVPAVPIARDADGAPVWPAGVVGSMTHCAGYRAAVVARAAELRSVGIDAEPHAALPEEVRELVVSADAVDEAIPHWDRVVFCAKEAVYKAWFPLTRRRLDFADVATTVRRDGSFDARVYGERSFGGRWLADRGLVVAATWVTA